MMESKKSWFNKAALRLDLHNSWPIWAGYTLFWLVAASFIATNYYTSQDFQHQMARFWEGCTNLANSFAVPVYGCVVAVWLLRGLFHSRSALAIHALPVDRKQLFAAHLISGVVLNAIPTLALALYGTARFMGSGSDLVLGFWTLVDFLGASWLAYLWAFGFALFCGMLTGQLVMVPVLYGVFSFLSISLSTLLDSMFRKFLPGYAPGNLLGDLGRWLSPWYSMGMDVSWNNSRFDSWVTMLVYALAGAVLMGAAYQLYRRRPLERAGELIIHRPARVVFRLGVALCAALFGSAFFQLLLGVSDSVIAVYILMIICGGVGLLGTRMLELKSFHVINFRLMGEYGGVAAALGLLMVVLNTGGLGYVTRVPQPEQVKRVSFIVSGSVYCGPVEMSWSNLILEDPEQIEQLCQWHREYSQLLLQNPNYPDEKMEQQSDNETVNTQENTYDQTWSYGTGYNYSNIFISYTLNNGTTLSRKYGVTTSRQEVGDPTSPDGQMARLLAGVDMPEILESWAPYLEVYFYEDGIQYEPGARNKELVLALAEDLREGGWTCSLLEQDPFWEQDITLELTPDYGAGDTQELSAQGGSYPVRVNREYTPRTQEVLEQKFAF